MKKLLLFLIVCVLVSCVFFSNSCSLLRINLFNYRYDEPANPVRNGNWLQAYQNVPIEEKNSVLAESTVAILSMDTWIRVKCPIAFYVYEGYHDISMDMEGKLYQSVVLYYRYADAYGNDIFEYLLWKYAYDTNTWDVFGTPVPTLESYDGEGGTKIIKSLMRYAVENGIKLTSYQMVNVNYHIDRFQSDESYVERTIQIVCPDDIDKSLLRIE